MRILILGAGGTGGYFGGRLAQAGVDVTFLVRPARAAQLQRDGLVIRSPLGDAAFPVAHVTADALPALAAARPFDLAMLSCKAYDLDGSIDAIAPAVGPGTTVLPILNGLRHYGALDTRFGRDAVLGGLCFISATKADDGAVVHLDKPARLTFGERYGAASARVAALAAACETAGIDHVASDDIAGEQWIKYTFLATLAAGTCLMRADVGHIVATDHGIALMRALYDECLAAAAHAGQPIPAKAQDIALSALTRAGSPIKASMLRDLEAGQRVEAEHIVGDMLERAQAAGQAAPLLRAAYCHLQAYEAQRGA
ncbi:2-dehydropantoate 2-reductase [Stenotrophomonas sp. MYb238]|uniref:2-dehydropantoate 2-reductase n=1 Tax=Stenotrophomonas sp. MYb238 TaxID=2040281 RepID=UPI001291E476|nr:2-dehydropantoate 2-reductase [Stenotrophomonas sp. MYb238]MQP76154.1 2-dehydropantoate 2-reductase [Stenotrophomonas sp. MYb238]